MKNTIRRTYRMARWPLLLLLLFVFVDRSGANEPSGHQAAPAFVAKARAPGEKPSAEELVKVDEAIVSHFPFLSEYGQVGAKCVECHTTQFNDISRSIHGKAGLLSKMPEGSICLTCHEVNHVVQNPVRMAKLNLDPIKIPRDLACMRCHADPVIAATFNFPPHVPGEFEKSIHYRKAMLGEIKAPLCFDCHGAHTIARVEDPSSPVHEAQREKVCARCHAGANKEFSLSFDHKPVTMEGKPLEFWTIAMFKVLTLGTFMALGLYILLDFISIIRLALTPKSKNPYAHAHKKKDGKVKYVGRLDLHSRIQHFFMLTSVIGLVLTGWPLLEPNSDLAHAMMSFLGGAGRVAVFHRIFGFILIGDFIYHIIYLYFQFRAHARMHPMIPMPKDIIDVYHMLLFFFGLRQTRPDFEQFSFLEKFDYWAVFWGVAMMGASGLILMFPTIVTHILPSASIKLALIIHADEALLAATVLFIWHFYNVHLKPGIFPMNWAWITGKMEKDVYEEEHAAHVARLKKEGKWEEDD